MFEITRKKFALYKKYFIDFERKKNPVILLEM